MKSKTLFCLFALFVLTSLVFAQSTTPGNDPSSPRAGSDRQPPGTDIEVKTSTHEDVKTTESQIKDLKKRLEKLEREFNKKQKELNDKITNEKDEKKLAKLKSELEKLEKKFKDEKEKTEGTLARLERFPIEQQTRDTKSSMIVPGNCGNLLALPPMDARRQVVESMGPPSSCYEEHGRHVSMQITDASPYLSHSHCFHPMQPGGRNGDFEFLAPGLTFMIFCNISGTNCKMIVFMEHFNTLLQIALSYGNRDNLLVAMCPPAGQVEYPSPGFWDLLPLEVNHGEDNYERVIYGILGGQGGISRNNFGLEGLNVFKETAKDEDLVLRNIVLDNKLPDLIEKATAPFLEIDKRFAPFLEPAMNELSFINKVAGRVNILLNNNVGAGSLEEVRMLIADITKNEYKPKDFPIYVENLSRAEKFLAEGKKKEAKKSLEDFEGKFLEKEEKKIAKSYGRSLDARARTLNALNKWEFSATADALSDFVKTYPDKTKRKEFDELLKGYKNSIGPLRDYVDKLKDQLTRELKQGELLEPIVIKSGDKVVFLVSVTGADYDFERQNPKLRAVLEEKFAPVDENGAVPKGGTTYDNTVAGIISFDELISRGFTTAVVETQNGNSIVVAVKKGKLTLSLRTFHDGATTNEVDIKELEEKSGLVWISVMLPKRMSQSAIPKDPNAFLSTFDFLDKESHRMTVIRFIFLTARVLSLKDEATGERIDLPYFLYPGGYENTLTIIDALKQSAKKREIKLPPIHFRVLPPDSNDKSNNSEKKE